jgi:large subunit ribosomal protein L4
MTRAALRGALSAKLGDEAIRVIDAFGLEAIKTREVLGILGALKASGRILVVAPGSDERLWLSTRNLPTVDVILADSLNVVDLVNADTIVIEQPALARLGEVYR